MKSIKLRMEIALCSTIESISWSAGLAVVRRRIHDGTDAKIFGRAVEYRLNGSDVRGYDNEPLRFKVVETGVTLKKNNDPKEKVAKVSHWWAKVEVLNPCPKCKGWTPSSYQHKECGWDAFAEV